MRWAGDGEMSVRSPRAVESSACVPRGSGLLQQGGEKEAQQQTSPSMLGVILPLARSFPHLLSLQHLNKLIK